MRALPPTFWRLSGISTMRTFVENIRRSLSQKLGGGLPAPHGKKARSDDEDHGDRRDPVQCGCVYPSSRRCGGDCDRPASATTSDRGYGYGCDSDCPATTDRGRYRLTTDRGRDH